MKRLCIQGGHVIDAASGQNAVADVWIADGVIAGIGNAPAGFVADRVLAAEGCIVSAGWVDLCARIGSLDHLTTETAAAVKSGVTTFCTPPDLSPIIDSPAVAELVQQRAAALNRCRVVPLGALTQGLQGNALSAMAALKAAGCVGVSQAQQALKDTRVLRHALEYAATLDLPVFLYAEDPWLAKGGVVHEGSMSTKLGLPAIPAIAEVIAVNTILLLAKATGARVHFCRLSTADAVALLQEAQAEGLPVTADVAIHQLFLTEAALADFNDSCHVRPPLRTEADRLALRTAVAKGIVTAICSDHTPCTVNGKLAPFAATQAGISALETWLPLVLQLVAEGVCDLPTLLTRVTQHPADILRLKAGRLQIGAPADICVFDPNTHLTLTPDRMASYGRNTPFLGTILKGTIKTTVVNGDIVIEF